MLNKILTYLTLTLFTTALAEYWIITQYRTQIDALKTTNIIGKINEKTLSDAIDEQNKALDIIKVDYKANLDKYKNRPPAIEYITKYITKEINVTRSNCKDVSSLISNIRNNGL